MILIPVSFDPGSEAAVHDVVAKGIDNGRAFILPDSFLQLVVQVLMPMEKILRRILVQHVHKAGKADVGAVFAVSQPSCRRMGEQYVKALKSEIIY